MVKQEEGSNLAMSYCMLFAQLDMLSMAAWTWKLSMGKIIPHAINNLY